MKEENLIKSITTNTAIIKLIDDTILSISFLDNNTIGIEESIENKKAGESLMHVGVKYGVLVNALPFFSYTQEAREFEMKQEQDRFQQIRAIAIVVKHLHLRILSHFILKFNRDIRLIKTKVCSTEKEAIDWLKLNLG